MNIVDYIKSEYTFTGWLLIISISVSFIALLILWPASQTRDLMNFQDKLSKLTDFEIEDHADYKIYKCIGYKLEINPEAAWVDEKKIDTSFPKAINTLSDEYKEKLERNCQLLTGQMLPFEISYIYSNKPNQVTGQFILRGIKK